MSLVKTNMDSHYSELIDGKTNDFLLPPDDAKLHHRMERVVQLTPVVDLTPLPAIIPVEVVHTSEIDGPRHRLGEKPKLIKSFVDAAKRGL